MHGRGMWRSPETGTIYWGRFDQGLVSGTGRMLFGDKSLLKDPGGSYVGEWKSGKFHGREGVVKWRQVSRHLGVQQGVRQWDEEVSQDGSSYTGVPVKGTMEYPNDDKFQGAFTLER
ncbi:hypothetical protein Pelo_18927 [Pelomyxa schiedti]|nr:hypothetical protein Pelo_18927 [Pelomyxa schiedti]